MCVGVCVFVCLGRGGVRIVVAIPAVIKNFQRYLTGLNNKKLGVNEKMTYSWGPFLQFLKSKDKEHDFFMGAGLLFIP